MTRRRDKAHPCEPVGVGDIAERCGYQPNTVAVYKTNGLLPVPRWTISAVPAWCWQHDIEPLLVDGKLLTTIKKGVYSGNSRRSPRRVPGGLHVEATRKAR